jgi:hypothetical protein
LENLTTKTILSVGLSNDLFRYIADGTKLVEFETGNQTTNITYTGSLESSKVSVVQVTQSDATVKTYNVVYSGSIVTQIIQS